MTPTEPNGLAPAADSPARTRPKLGWLPWAMLAVGAVYLISVYGRMAPPTKPADLDAFGRIPVVDGGRVKPLETVARVNLRLISQREEFYDDKGAKQPAIRWLLEVMANGAPEHKGASWKYEVFRIENDQLLTLLDLKPREGLRYSRAEIEKNRDKLDKRVRDAEAKPKEKRDLVDNKAAELNHRVEIFDNLARFGGPLLLPPQSAGGEWGSLGQYRMTAIMQGFRDAVPFAQERLRAEPNWLARITKEQEDAAFEHFRGLVPRVLSEAELKELAERVKPKAANPLTDADMKGILYRVAMTDPAKLLPVEERDLLFGLQQLLSDADRQALRDRVTADLKRRTDANPAAGQWVRMADAYRESKPDEFNRLAGEYRGTYLQHVPADELSKLNVEVAYDRFQPFYQCVVLYILVVVLSAVSWLGWNEPLRRSSLYLLYLTLALHTVALIVRMYVQGRPPVTNLYSSAVFIGWGCVGLGLVLEKLYPIGIGNLLAAVLGFATNIISHNLAASGDTMEMMQAVLDTNFWLATHVTTVTLGYTATFVAGFVGVAFVTRLVATVVRDAFLTPGTPSNKDLLVFGAAAAGLVAIPVMLVALVLKALADYEVIHDAAFTLLLFLTGAGGFVYAVTLLFLRASAEGTDAGGPPVAGTLPGPAKVLDALALDAVAGRNMAQMVYGVVCFATLLSFVGTVLGGIWADQSWGRFWGWDPKENGAVLIVLWNALILHARWAGMVRDRGVAVLAVAGNMVTAWSWFGTNQLGIGLHAYGFDNRLATGCRYFWLSQLVVIGLGCIPQRYWASATRRVYPSAPAPAPLPAASTNGHVVASVPAPTPAAVAAAPVAAPRPNPQPQPAGPGRGGKGKKNRKKR